MIHDRAELIAGAHVRWIDHMREGHQHVWEALALARHTTTFALKLAYPRLQDALAASWLMLAYEGDDGKGAGASLCESPDEPLAHPTRQPLP